jgi:hypothetical protein
MTDITYEKGLTLGRLEQEIATDEARIGTLTNLDHTDDETVAVYEDGRAPDNPIELRTQGGDAVPDGYSKVCDGTVWIIGQLQDVTAVRKD